MHAAIQFGCKIHQPSFFLVEVVLRAANCVLQCAHRRVEANVRAQLEDVSSRNDAAVVEGTRVLVVHVLQQRCSMPRHALHRVTFSEAFPALEIPHPLHPNTQPYMARTVLMRKTTRIKQLERVTARYLARSAKSSWLLMRFHPRLVPLNEPSVSFEIQFCDIEFWFCLAN